MARYTDEYGTNFSTFTNFADVLQYVRDAAEYGTPEGASHYDIEAIANEAFTYEGVWSHEDGDNDFWRIVVENQISE